MTGDFYSFFNELLSFVKDHSGKADDLPLVVAMNPVTLHTNVLNGYSPRMTEYMSIGMLITANMISMAARFRSIQWYGVRI